MEEQSPSFAKVLAVLQDHSNEWSRLAAVQAELLERLDTTIQLLASLAAEVPRLQIPDMPAPDVESIVQRHEALDARLDEERRVQRDYEQALLGELRRHTVLLERIVRR